MRSLTAHKAVGIFDLFLSDEKVLRKIKVSDLEPVAVSSILIACKFEETMTPRIYEFLRETGSKVSEVLI